MKNYTVKEVANMFSVDPETVRRWIRNKKLSSNKSSRKKGNNISEEDIRMFIKNNPKYRLHPNTIISISELNEINNQDTIMKKTIENIIYENLSIIFQSYSHVCSRSDIELMIHRQACEIATSTTIKNKDRISQVS